MYIKALLVNEFIKIVILWNTDVIKTLPATVVVKAY